MYPLFEDETEDSIPKPEAALNRMVEDRLYWGEQDPEFRSYVDDSFESVYGDGAAEQDASGRTVTPAARPVALPPFRPSVTPEDTNLADGVGEGQANAWRDVLKVQKGLSNTGHYALDMAKEKSGEHSPTLAQAIRNFQREKREEIDGILLPGGPTITRMRENLFDGSQKLPAISPLSNADGLNYAILNLPANALGRTPSFAKEGASQSDELGVIPVQFDPNPGPPDSPSPPTHREAEDRGMQRMVPYHVIDLPDRSKEFRATGPSLYREAERRQSIISNTPGRIVVREDSSRTGRTPGNAIHAPGQAAVELFDRIIQREAARQGVDPNLVRAIMYVENAQGWYGKAFEGIGAKSILPMNIRYDLWGGLGFSERDSYDATMNVRAGTMLIRRILDRLDEPTVSKLATLYNSLAKDSVSDFGARVAEVYRARAWERKDRVE